MASLSADQLDGFFENHYRQIYADWADVPIPALGDQAPKDAVKTPKGRQAVIDLLDSYDRNERQMAEQQGRNIVNLDFLRREVGLLG